MQITPLTSAEEQFMQLFWKLGNFYTKDILENAPEPKPHQNTVSTYLKILIKKGFLSAKKEGRIFHYSVAIPKSEYRNLLLTNLINDFYDHAGKEVLSTLIDEKLISQEDLVQYFDLKIEMKATEEEPEYKIASEILKGRKEKKKKKKKKK